MSDSRVDSVTGLARMLTGVTAWIARHPWLAIVFCVATLGASIEVAREQLTYRTQRDDLMSADKACQVRWRNYLREFGSDDDIVFVVEGRDRDRMKAAMAGLGDRLRQEPELFDRIFYRADLRTIRNRALLFLNENELKALDERVAQLGPLLGPIAGIAWQSLTLRTLTGHAAAILERHAAGGEPTQADREFLAQYAAIVESAERTLRNPSAYSNPWPALSPRDAAESSLDQPRWFFSDDGALAFLLARPAKADQQSFTPVAASVTRARALIQEVGKEFPDLSFGLTGLPVLEHDEMDGTDRDSMRAAWLALAGMALLYFIVYRGLRYPLLTVASLLTGTLWALGLTAVTIGHLNILSSAFAVMLIGMGDYGVLWVARFDEERQTRQDIHEALRATAAHAGPSILTAAITTSLAFFAIMLADFQAVAELGFIAGSGVLLCALACFVLMPALLVLTRRQPKPGVLKFVPRSPIWLGGILNRPRLVLAVSAVLVALSAVSAWSIRYDQNLLRLQSQDLDSVQWEKKLLRGSPGAGWHAISVARSPEEAVELRRRYEQLPEVGRVDEVASLMPADQDRKLPSLAEVFQKLEFLPPRDQAMRHPRPDGEELRLDIAKIRKLSGAKSLNAALERFETALSARPAGLREEIMTVFEGKMSADLWDGLQRLKESSAPQAIASENLPVELRERFVGSSGKWLVRAFAREDLWEPDALARFVEKTRTVDPEATGKPFGTLEGLRSMTTGYFHAGIYALLAIAIILGCDFRSGRCVLLALLPLGIGMVMSLGVLQLLGASLNPANLVALPLIVGVGVDNGVHVLHDYRTRAPGTAYRMSSATGRGILVAALTTILGFATLMISRHEGMFGLGLMLSLGVTCCMFAALIVLPATLQLLDRRSLATVKSAALTVRKAA